MLSLCSRTQCSWSPCSACAPVCWAPEVMQRPVLGNCPRPCPGLHLTGPLASHQASLRSRLSLTPTRAWSRLLRHTLRSRNVRCPSGNLPSWLGGGGTSWGQGGAWEKESKGWDHSTPALSLPGQGEATPGARKVGGARFFTSDWGHGLYIPSQRVSCSPLSRQGARTPSRPPTPQEWKGEADS